MINRIKTLVVIIFGVLGLSGCIVVDDDIQAYSPYPYGGYEAAIDYYHRPPRYHNHRVHVKPRNHHKDEHHPINKPKQPDKMHGKKKPEQPDSNKKINKPKPEQPKKVIKEPKPEQPKKVIKEKTNPKITEHPDLKRKDIGNMEPGHHTIRHR